MSVRDEFKINALRDIELYECICNDCGNKFKGLPVDNIECLACRSTNIYKRQKRRRREQKNNRKLL